MASPQCLGYRGEHGVLTKDICYPAKDQIIQQVINKVKQTNVDAIFIATDEDDLIEELQQVLQVYEWRG